MNIENAGTATWMKHPTNGKRLFYNMATGDIRVLEITGPFDSGITREYSEIYLPSSETRSGLFDEEGRRG